MRADSLLSLFSVSAALFKSGEVIGTIKAHLSAWTGRLPGEEYVALRDILGGSSRLHLTISLHGIKPRSPRVLINHLAVDEKSAEWNETPDCHFTIFGLHPGLAPFDAKSCTEMVHAILNSVFEASFGEGFFVRMSDDGAYDPQISTTSNDGR